MPDIRHKRGTKAALDSLAGSSGLKVGQIYHLTDTKQLAMAITTGTYELYSRAGEQGIVVSPTEPSSPYTGMLWVDSSGA